jgi:hypothetical protein
MWGIIRGLAISCVPHRLSVNANILQWTYHVRALGAGEESSFVTGVYTN